MSTQEQTQATVITVADDSAIPRRFLGYHRDFVLEHDGQFIHARSNENMLAGNDGLINQLSITIQGTSQVMVEQAIDRLCRSESQNIDATDIQIRVHPIDTYREYQLVRRNEMVYAIPLSLGNVDLQDESQRKRSEILCSERVENVKLLIDKLCLLEKLQKWYDTY